MKKIVVLMLMLFVTTTVAKTIEFNRDITGESAHYLTKALINAHKNIPMTEVIDILITSYGGSVHAGFNILNTIRAIQSEGRIITITVDRVCMSMCFSILQSADVRRAYKYGVLMQHKTSGGGPVALAMDRQLEAMEAERIGKNKAIWQYIVKANIFISPTEALAWNIIDVIVDKPTIRDIDIITNISGV